MNNENLKLSVVEIEKKYTVSTNETVYGGGKGIVSWGEDNSLPNLLATCYDESATLKAVIDQTVSYLKGDGININEKASKWAEKINRRGLTLEDLVEHLGYDFITYGNFAVQVVFNKLGVPCELFPLDVTRCRLSEDGDVVYYSKKSWTKYQTKAEAYARFGRADFDPEKPTQIYFYNGNGIRRVYNRAPWFSSLDDVLTEIESGHYSLNAVSNGFAAKYIINLPQTSNLTDEQKRTISDGIKEKFCGPDAESNFMLYWSDGDAVLDVKKIEADETPERFNSIRKASKDSIFTSLRMNPLLCGYAAENTGFSTSEFSDSFKLYEKTVAAGWRALIEKAISEMTGVEKAVTIKPFVINFETQE